MHRSVDSYDTTPRRVAQALEERRPPCPAPLLLSAAGDICELRSGWQVVAGAVMLAGYWLLFVAYPSPDGAWSQKGNIGALIDLQILGYNYAGDYTTINFIGNSVTILFGCWAGALLRTPGTHAYRLKVLGICAAAGLAGGLALEPFVPTVKRLWTPSFTLFSAGWVIVVLMAFYWIVEVRKLTGWAFHCIVFGMNSIFAYSIGPIGLKGWLNRGLGAFTFHFKFMGDLGAMPQQMLVMGCIWGTCYWLYKRGIFLSCDSYEVHRVPVGYRASDPCRSDWRVGPHACR